MEDKDILGIRMKGSSYSYDWKPWLEKQENDAVKRFSCKDFSGINLWNIRPEEAKKNMHEYLCNKIYHSEKATRL